MWLISEPSPGFFGTVQSLTAAHLLSGCWAAHHDVRLNAFGGTMFRKPSYKKLLLAFCCLCFAIQYIPKMLLLFVYPTFLFYIHCCLLSSLHFYMNAAKYFLVLIISYFRRNFCEPKKLFTKVQTMEFQFNQANQATALIHDHFVATFWEAATKLLILTGTPQLLLPCCPISSCKEVAKHQHFHLHSVLGTYCSKSPDTAQDLFGWWFWKGNIFVPIHPFTDGWAEAEEVKGIQLKSM